MTSFANIELCLSSTIVLCHTVSYTIWDYSYLSCFATSHWMEEHVYLVSSWIDEWGESYGVWICLTNEAMIVPLQYYVCDKFQHHASLCGINVEAITPCDLSWKYYAPKLHRMCLLFKQKNTIMLRVCRSLLLRNSTGTQNLYSDIFSIQSCLLRLTCSFNALYWKQNFDSILSNSLRINNLKAKELQSNYLNLRQLNWSCILL